LPRHPAAALNLHAQRVGEFVPDLGELPDQILALARIPFEIVGRDFPSRRASSSCVTPKSSSSCW
jgi:hypothetical protein